MRIGSRSPKTRSVREMEILLSLTLVKLSISYAVLMDCDRKVAEGHTSYQKKRSNTSRKVI